MKIFIISLLTLSSLVFYCQGRLLCSQYHPCKNGGLCENGTGICYCPQTYFGEMCEHRHDCHEECPYDRVCVRKYNKTFCDEPYCSPIADILFMIDSSGSISKSEFKMMLDAIEIFIGYFHIGFDQIRVAICAFNDYIKDITVIHLNEIGNKNLFVQKLRKLADYHTGGGTRTDKALAFARENIFTPAKGDRDVAPNIALIFTDGQSSESKYTAMQANLIKQTDIHLIPIGIGNNIYKGELEMIATRKEDVTYTNFTAMASIVETLVNKTCNSSRNPCYSSPCKNGGECRPFLTEYICNCKAPYAGVNCEIKCDIHGDIMVVIDESGSISPAKFGKMVDAVIFFIKSLDINNGKVRVGIITYALDVFLHYDLDAYDNKLTMLYVANAIRFMHKGGPTFTHKALRYLKDNSFTYAKGDRPNYPNYVLLFTDGKSRFPWKTRNAAEALRITGVVIYAIGVGPKITRREIYNIASQPKRYHMLITSFKRLNWAMRRVLGHICYDLKPKPPCLKCNRRCKCYPGMKCCGGCCEDTVTLAS